MRSTREGAGRVDAAPRRAHRRRPEYRWLLMDAATHGTGIYFDGVSARRQAVTVDLRRTRSRSRRRTAPRSPAGLCAKVQRVPAPRADCGWASAETARPRGLAFSIPRSPRRSRSGWASTTCRSRRRSAASGTASWNGPSRRVRAPPARHRRHAVACGPAGAPGAVVGRGRDGPTDRPDDPHGVQGAGPVRMRLRRRPKRRARRRS